MTDPSAQKPPSGQRSKNPADDGLDPREISRDLEKLVPSLSRIPEHDRVRAIEVIAAEVAFSGPLPPPSMLKKYEETLPGLADRIVSMAEQELKHSQSTSDQIIQSEIRAQSRDNVYRLCGMATALVALIGMLWLIAFLAQIGQPWLAGTLGFGSIAIIVGLFIHGQSDRNSDRARADSRPSGQTNKPSKRRR